MFGWLNKLSKTKMIMTLGVLAIIFNLMVNILIEVVTTLQDGNTVGI